MSMKLARTAPATFRAIAAAGLVLAGALFGGSVFGGCAFGDGIPEEGTLLCVRDDQCPEELSCDSFRHVCVGAGTDIGAPALASIGFTPAVARAGLARLTLRASEDLSTEVAPVIAFASGVTPPPLTAEEGSGPERSFVVDVDALAEGAYPVIGVEIVDASGIRAIIAVNSVSLTVDRTPPVLRNPTLGNAPMSGVYSDLAPDNIVEGRFLASEPLDLGQTELRIGPLTSGADGCVVGEGGSQIVCRTTLSAGAVPDGPVVATLVARDQAGNEATAELDVTVDTAPPGIVPDSVTVQIDTAGVETSVARADSTVRVTLVATEPLADNPRLVLVASSGDIELPLIGVTGARATFARSGGFDVEPGAWPLRATLADRFGHAAAPQDVPLPPGMAAGVLFVADGDVCPRPAGVTCVDLDGDGHPASGSCAAGDDADDLDVTVYPGAVERPGDGIDNDQMAGDLPIDETTGVFVDADGGDDVGGDGTRAAPYATLDVAMARSAGGTRLYLATSAVPYTTAGSLGRSLLGGLDPVTWQRTGARAVVEPAGQFDAWYLDGIESQRTAQSSDKVVFDSVLAHVGAYGGCSIVRSNVGLVSARSTYIAESTIGHIATDIGTTVVQRTRVTGELHVADYVAGASLSVVNSVVQRVVCDSCAFAEIVHSTIGTPSFAAADELGAVVELNAPQVARIVGSALGGLRDRGPSLSITGGGNVSVSATNFFHPARAAVVVDAVPFLDLASLAGCSGAACPTVSACLELDPGGDAVASLPTASPLRDAAGSSLAAGLPTSALADIELDCRFADSGADAGADELP